VSPSLELTPELVARYPRPGMAVPAQVRYSPDGRWVTYLHSQSGDLVRDLWRMELKTGRSECWISADQEEMGASFSPDELLRRERARIRGEGVTEYLWAKDAPVLLTVLKGDLYRWSDGNLVRAAKRVIDPKISDDGRRAFFIRDREVWCVDERGEVALTSGSAPGISNGVAEFVAQEELDRLSGYWPSPDGGRVAFAQVDERHIPIYPIVHQGKQPVEIEEHRYPFAGAANARVKLGIVRIDGGDPVWLDLGKDDIYLARVDWHPDGRLFVQVLSRDQKRLELRAYDAEGRASAVLVEESPVWINLHDDLRFHKATGEFVWSSERSGFRHLYLYASSGALVRPLTSGEWPVDAMLDLDEGAREVYFAAGRDSPTHRQVFKVSLDGGEPQALTREPGMHDAVFAPDFSSYIHSFHNRSNPPALTLRRPEGSPTHVLHPAAAIELDLPSPELHRFSADDGTVLHAAVYRPKTSGKAPVVVEVYGGPQAQMVVDGWDETVDLRAQLLAREGFVVLKVDNRGSSRRGLAFEAHLAGRFGEVELRDQVAGVKWLGSLGFADLSRVGIYGWSYGGYMTTIAMTRATDIFKVGVAGAPSTTEAAYDTAYTERYLGTPRDNPDGYRESAAITYAAGLKGKLLLIHGLIDENVHFRHTALFIDALNAANKPYDLLIYPNERHMPRSEKDRLAMETRILEYFKQHL